MNIQTNSPMIQRNVLAAADEIKKSIDAIEGFSEDQKSQAKEAVESTQYEASDVPNTTVYQIAVGALAVAAGIIVVGGVVLAFRGGGNTPEFLQVTLATIVGALAGMIIPTGRTE